MDLKVTGASTVPPKPKTKTEILRDVLSDGEWHTSSDLVRRGCGYRYGAIIQRVRRGMDGQPPLNIETKQVSVSKFKYRAVPHGD